jgi:hypothetical protein
MAQDNEQALLQAKTEQQNTRLRALIRALDALNAASKALLVRVQEAVSKKR